MGKRVERTRNAGTETEAAFWSRIRSALRRANRFWKPIKNTELAARREYQGENKRQKWEYQCAHCKGWFTRKEVEVDHIIPAGSLRCYEDLAPFVQKLFAEEGYQVLCKSCHTEKTAEERKK